MSDFVGQYSGEPTPRSMLVEGPFGAGKTTFAIETLFEWLESGVPAERILVMVPQRTLARRYLLALRDVQRGPAGMVEVRTLGGLAKDMVTLYWPVVAEEAGFHEPQRGARFLTIETSQYVMARFVDEAVERGEFDAINVSPPQIARQVIDNLGKAALMGIDYREVPGLLAAAWGPERPTKRVLAYQAAGRVAHAYRQYCLRHRLLDYSLQIELFTRLLKRPAWRERFYRRHTHLIIEHIEEEPPLAHELIRNWLSYAAGALLTYEWDGGYRVFLGADPQGAERLAHLCEATLTLGRSRVCSPQLEALRGEVAYALRRPSARPAAPGTDLGFEFEFHRFYPQMLDWVAAKIAHLVHTEGLPPREIVVLAPFLSDALRFSLGQKLNAYGIAHISHRPSRALRDESAVRCALTLAALVYLRRRQLPPRDDVAQALQFAIAGLDPVRARLLAMVVYHPTAESVLTPFERIKPEMQARITYTAGQRYDYLLGWLLDRAAEEPAPIDHFFSRLFEELSRPGFGFHGDPQAGRVMDELIESARKFRQSLFPDESVGHFEVAQRYLSIVNQGLLAALYVASWQEEAANAVFMAPAYTFLMRNRAATVQFWLDAGSNGWWERLDQPLTHPYVLSPSWPPGRLWTDTDEYERQQDMLYRLVSGLISRCRERIYLGISDLDEQGYEERGPLLRVFQQILRRHPRTGEVAS